MPLNSHLTSIVTSDFNFRIPTSVFLKIPLFLENLHVVDFLPVDGETQHCNLFVKTGFSCRAWIKVQEIKLVVIHHL